MQPADVKDLKISPRARNTAERLGVDVRYAKPTGPYGRIIERDVIAARDAGHMMTPAAQAAAAGIPGGVVGTGLGGRVTTRDLETPAAAAGTVQPEVSAEDWLVLDPAYDEVKVPNIRKVIAKAMHQSLATTAQLTLNSSFDATEILEYRKKLKETQERMGLAISWTTPSATSTTSISAWLWIRNGALWYPPSSMLISFH